MDRHIAVPASMMVEGKLPTKALELARLFSLEIRKSEDHEKISIVSTPKHRTTQYSSTYKDGLVWSLNFVDEFTDLNEETFITIDDIAYRPIIRELHSAKFRVRIHGTDKKEICLFVNGELRTKDTLREINECAGNGDMHQSLPASN